MAAFDAAAGSAGLAAGLAAAEGDPAADGEPAVAGEPAAAGLAGSVGLAAPVVGLAAGADVQPMLQIRTIVAASPTNKRDLIKSRAVPITILHEGVPFAR
ncbi:MAG TPA: hypothetical protein VHX16_03560 [Chloroflexota bacterium]|nr:hypothetical protein [Chloroflexota bacterium]